VPEAETWPQVRRRALAGLSAPSETPAATPHRRRPRGRVSHGALIREVIRHASAGAFPLEGERLANASTHRFLVERDRLSVPTPRSR
jgi:broad specificity phosphatase PhoE